MWGKDTSNATTSWMTALIWWYWRWCSLRGITGCMSHYDDKGGYKNPNASGTSDRGGQGRVVRWSGSYSGNTRIVLLERPQWHPGLHSYTRRPRANHGTRILMTMPPLVGTLFETGGTHQQASHVRHYHSRALLTTYGQRCSHNSRGRPVIAP